MSELSYLPEQCYCYNCPNPGDDEYTYMEYVPALEREFPVTWKLCASHCEFAVEMVECISNLEDELERWIKNGT